MIIHVFIFGNSSKSTARIHVSTENLKLWALQGELKLGEKNDGGIGSFVENGERIIWSKKERRGRKAERKKERKSNQSKHFSDAEFISFPALTLLYLCIRPRKRFWMPRIIG